MSELVLKNESLPGLYQSADAASLEAQTVYFIALKAYLFLLVVAAFVSFAWPKNYYGAIVSAVLFLLTLGILIYLRVYRPDDIWYNGRAVAESVKTRAWRWVMRAEPYEDTDSIEIVSKQFINDLKTILHQNRSLSKVLDPSVGSEAPISEVMASIRRLSVEERLSIYQVQRIVNQATWYSKKSLFNKRRSKQWFGVSVALHLLAFIMLLYRIKDPLMSLPVESIAVAAGAVLTWLQAKKHNELNSSYSLAAHEIVLIKGESLDVKSEKELSAFVLDSESAFSREHTQWTARKVE
ncbi:DUF4231 domain-containing protein [Myxococcota bacterium]|nr:DUF4231 domain-containing protein [Myxococcota bacterium]MBU1381374.1 DUF4231 domain-containing protein [Myxococcota bacterium]MBU1498377.1 DUF4231 domain-containing protein [Myxococcota bacterium]